MASLPAATTTVLTTLGKTAFLTPATKTTPEQEFRTNLKDGFRFELESRKPNAHTLASLPAHIPESFFDNANRLAPIGLGREPFLTALLKEVTDYKTKQDPANTHTHELLSKYQEYIHIAIEHLKGEASA